LAAALGLMAGLAPVTAHAQLVIDINKANPQPLPVAIPAFSAPATSTVGADIARVVTGDLQRSGLFRPLDPNSFIERNLDFNIQPRFSDWKTIGAQALINGKVDVDADGRLHVDFRLWDVASESALIQGVEFTTTPENWRRTAHKLADAVYEKLTGEKGYFDTRIVFVSESGPKTKRRKQLTIMDQDGANPSFLTSGNTTVMTPRFSSSSQEITYMTLTPNSSNIYLFNIETGRQETLGRFQGMVFAPRFSPDGSKVAFSMEQRGNSDIYVMDLRSRQTTRLTYDPSIDTSPSFSPDGKQIVFNSDRGGSPQLWVMNADGSGARQISFGGGRYTTPVWSPRGDYIAFTKQTGGDFHIGVMKPDGSDERLLTSAFLDEGPTWAPNGRVLMFFRETPGSGPHLWTVNVTGNLNLQEAPYPGQASDPAWSPLLN
jgi:TolB protein